MNTPLTPHARSIADAIGWWSDVTLMPIGYVTRLRLLVALMTSIVRRGKPSPSL